MQRYGRIFTGYWTSPDIIELPLPSKLIGAYLLTCHHGNMLGCFRLPIAYAVEDLREGFETVSEGFRNLSEKDFLTYDSDLSWVLIRKFLKWNPIDNPNQGKAAAKLVEQVPRNSSVYELLVRILKDNPANFPEGFLNGLETVSEPYRNQQPQPQPQPQLQPELKNFAHVSDEPSAGAVFHLPLKDGSEYGLQSDLYAEFCKAYPAVKVMEQLPAMRAWLLSNPGKRKTCSGIKAFINRWLSRERDKPDGASRNRSPRAESFAAIDYQKSYGLAPGEHVGLI